VPIEKEIGDSGEGEAVDLYEIGDSLNWEIDILVEDIDSCIVNYNWDIVLAKICKHLLNFVFAPWFHEIFHDDFDFDGWKLCLYGLFYLFEFRLCAG
jgi:hypothetical protein